MDASATAETRAGSSLFGWLLKMALGVAGVQGFAYLLTQVLGVQGSWSYIYLVLTLIDLAWLLFLLPLLTLLECGCLRQQGAPRRMYTSRLALIGVQVLLGAMEMVHFFQLYNGLVERMFLSSSNFTSIRMNSSLGGLVIRYITDIFVGKNRE